MIYTTGLGFMKSQDALLNALFQNNTPLQVAATETHRMMVKRIFEGGKDSNNAEIKNPSTKPIYVNPQNSPKKFAPVGKGKDKRGGRKTKYFEGGYAEFKRTIDRPKLVLFGQLRNDFRAGIKKMDQSSWISYFKNPVNAKKAEGIEKRYQNGEIFSLTKEEILLFKKLLVEGTIEYLKNDQ